MPTCKLCAASFPNHKIIDGKKVNLQRRKYCLSCSPYGKHNTRKIEINDNKSVSCEKEIICVKCTRRYVYSKKAGHTKTICNSCNANRKRLHFKSKCVEYKGGKCEKCGYNKCLRALSFHHTDPTKKDFGISDSHCRKWEVVKTELNKCLILCENCHMELHDELDK
jgi:hypothetical protein